jgi:hypothetical protein
MSDQKPAEQPPDDWVAQTDAEKDMVRNELARILRDPLFLASKRYPGLLRYVVEETLEGRGEQLKERTLGIEVFDREIDYDVGQDNVVRATATETRKRLAQYYAGLKVVSEVRISLVAGSYIPKFYKQLPVFEPPSRRLWPRAAVALLAILILGIISTFGWRKLRESEESIALFWRPFVEWNGPILVCMGSSENRVSLMTAGTTDSDPASPPQTPQSNDPYVRFSSAVNLARLAVFLETKGKVFRALNDSATSFADLRSGPAILMGLNQWALRLTAPLRFSIKLDSTTKTLWISDRQNPSRRDWASNIEDTGGHMMDDYALISRFVDRTTGQWVVVTSGLHRFGTSACTEFLSDREQMQLFAEKAPPGWDKLNLQLILSTSAVQGSNSRPRILESYFW